LVSSLEGRMSVVFEGFLSGDLPYFQSMITKSARYGLGLAHDSAGRHTVLHAPEWLLAS